MLRSVAGDPRRAPGRGRWRVWCDGAMSDARACFHVDAGGDAGTGPREFAEHAAAAEAAGYDGLIAAETRHDPFVSLSAAAVLTEQIGRAHV